MEILDRLLHKNKDKSSSNMINGKYMVSSDRELPEHCKTEAMYWKAKFYELKQEHRNTCRGLMRLARFKAKHRYVARACREAYRQGVKDERYKTIGEKESESDTLNK